MWVSVIHVYALIEDSKNEVKDDFYEQLKGYTVERYPSRIKWYLMADLNARVGRKACLRMSHVLLGHSKAHRDRG